MTSGTGLATIVAGALSIAAICNTATAQQVAPEGRVYVFHSKAAGQCPVLDWHVVVGPNNTLGGMIAWDNMKSMASVKGSITPAKTFSMTAKEVNGAGRTATVTGTLRSDGWLIANVKGPKIECDGIAVPWFVPPPQGNG